MGTDYYGILGVARDADEKALKKAYRELSKKYHPDLNPDDPSAEDKFKQVATAYAVLSDPEKRARYDRYGDAGDRVRVEDINPFDLFENFFGDIFGGMGGMGGGRSARPSRGEDMLVNVRVSFEEAARGIKTEVSVEDRTVCGSCRGSGAEEGSKPEPCPTCGGQGRVQQITRTFLGQMSTVTTCPRCNGQGRYVANPCRTCRGEGLTHGTREVEVNIPAGIFDGARLRLRGQGLPTEAGGPKGDLYVDVAVKPHPVFERDGLEVLSEVPVSFVCAALGGTIKVPTLDGEKEVKIPQGIQSGQNLRLRGLGIPDVNTGRRGDHIVLVQVEVPKKLSTKQKDLLKQFDEATEEKHRHPHKSLWERMKEVITPGQE